MNKTLTAEEFIINWTGTDDSNHPNEEVRNLFIQSKNQLIQFAKLHVEACKKDCYQKARISHDGYDIIIDQGSILNAYPLSNIK